MRSDTQSSSRKPRRAFRAAGFGLALAGALVLWFFREPLRNRVAEAATLANDAPPPEVVEEMIQRAADPRAALLAAWNSGKIIHREVAISAFRRMFPRDGLLPPEFESLLLSAALDPDVNVRETALGILRERRHPALTALVAQQLRDCDPQVRLLGLDQLKYAGPTNGVPMVVPLLDDSDPLVAVMSLKLLENWSGEKFGVKLSETASFENEKTGLEEYPEGSGAKAKAGAERAKEWWARHQTRFPPVQLSVPGEAFAARRPVPAGDFQLRTLAGDRIRLSDFRGKVVLINFWTTWCPACVGEMPELIALQKKHADQLVILGVSLDFVPDEDGHIGGLAPVEEQGQNPANHDQPTSSTESLQEVRDKVVRTVKARGINYPILLDEHNEIGGRFNGGELPTTVIVDARGNVRRRFVGARSLPVFEAMVNEARQPARFAGMAVTASGQKKD